MSRIDNIFTNLHQQKRKALMPFLVAGHPSLDATAEVITGAAEAGASILEIGFPFSDPIADGPVIAAAMYDALQHGVTPTHLFEMISSVRRRADIGLVAMVSQSIVHRMGGDRFISLAANAGFDGLIIPDLDLHAAEHLSSCAAKHDLAFTMLVAPTTSPARIQLIAKVSRGFLYLLARTGLTGERMEDSGGGLDIAKRIDQLRNLTKLPLAVGFGISTPEQVNAVTRHADAAIVGSALVRRMGDSKTPAATALTFIHELAGGLASTTRAASTRA